jgi:cellobiose-specific phosphotransferase system component IIB
MGFDPKAFMRQQFEPRQEAVEVAALADWFKSKDGDKCLWTVRGMTASELAKTMEAATKAKNFDSVIQAIGNSKETIKEIKAALGVGDDTPADIVKRLEQLTICSVDPVIELNVAVKLAETFPIEFYTLTNKIVMLTGMGMDTKKPQGSGETQPSEI